MSDQDLLRESIDRLLLDHDESLDNSSVLAFDDVLWGKLTTSGLDRIGLSERAGGSGGTVRDSLTVLVALGRHGAAVPVGETALLAGWLMERAGVALPAGVVAPVVGSLDAPIRFVDGGEGAVLSGVAHRIPWASRASMLAVLAVDGTGRHAVVTVDPADARFEQGHNLAGECRDDVLLGDIEVPMAAVHRVEGVSTHDVMARGALVRTAQMAGALQVVLDLTIRYVKERVQFGRSISSFQVIKQLTAELAVETAAGSVAAAGAASAIDRRDGWLEVAAARARTAQAATVAARISHQLHGALGFTEEHVLHRYTTRLWSWRDEYGTQASWERDLGDSIARSGATTFWPSIARLESDELPMGEHERREHDQKEITGG